MNIPLTKRFITRKAMFLLWKFRGTTYTDTMISGVNPASGNRLSQLYVTDFGDVMIYPFPKRKDAHTDLSLYFVNSGVPEHLHSDHSW